MIITIFILCYMLINFIKNFITFITSKTNYSISPICIKIYRFYFSFVMSTDKGVDNIWGVFDFF